MYKYTTFYEIIYLNSDQRVFGLILQQCMFFVLVYTIKKQKSLWFSILRMVLDRKLDLCTIEWSEILSTFLWSKILRIIGIFIQNTNPILLLK